MNGIRLLMVDLEDPYPLRRLRKEARERAARSAAVRSLSRTPPPEIAAEGEELRALERACAAREGRWEALEAAVAEGESTLGIEPAAPGPEVVAEIDLLTTGAWALRNGFAPHIAPASPDSGGGAGRTALAVGAGIALVALGAPHFAFHAALAANHAAKGPQKVKRPLPSKSPARALKRLRAGLPPGAPSADGVREALDALARSPRSREGWDAFLDAVQERLEVLRRAHLWARAEALLERRVH